MNKDIAIIGIAGRFPQAPNMEDFYRNLEMGKDSVRPLSIDRKSNTSLEVGKRFREMAFIDDVDKFDFNFFNIPLGEAMFISPDQRILLEVAYHTFENAAYDMELLNNSNTAIYVANFPPDYYKLADEDNSLLRAGCLNSSTSGRISRFFNLIGNSSLIDTACSSSLVALSMACNDLNAGLYEKAFVGTVNVKLFHRDESYVDKVGILSVNARSRSFSALADGTGSGEIAVGILLKPYHQALKDGDNIKAVIKGVGINQDAMRSSSLNAPSSLAQSEVIRQAWKNAGINPLTISYIETHGTGTKIGDPIEIEGISDAFFHFTNRKQFCAIGSLKTNIGHANFASGLASVAKVVLSLKHKKIFPSIHFEQPNELIDFIDSPVYVNASLQDWVNDGNLRRAGISSFGFSGTNCHIVLEEHNPPDDTASTDQASFIITCSAKSEESLKASLMKLRDYSTDAHLGQIAFTLNCGRTHYKNRFAALIQSKSEMRQKLTEVTSLDFSYSVDSVWFAFGADFEMDYSMIEKFSNQFDAFAIPVNECLAYLKKTEMNLKLTRFIFQYSLFKLLDCLGVKFDKILGINEGKLVTKIITGEITLEQALQRLLSNQLAEVGDLEAQLLLFVKTKILKEKIAVVEMGSSTLISSVIMKHCKNLEAGEVISLPQNERNFLVHEKIRTLYLLGFNIKWRELHRLCDAKRVELPLYEFKKTRCWIEEPSTTHLEKLIYQLEWNRESLPLVKTEVKNTTVFVVFMDSGELGLQLVKRLRVLRHRVVVINNNENFAELDSQHFNADWTNESHYKQLYEIIRNQAEDFHFVHLGGCEDEKETVKPLEHSLYSLFFLAKEFCDFWLKNNISLTVITGNSRKVLPADVIENPYSSTEHGFIIAFQKEFEKVKTKCIDIDLVDNVNDTADFLITEFFNTAAEMISAVRGGVKYIPHITHIEKQTPEINIGIQAGGVYIVSGGAKGVGLEVCRFISSLKKVTLVVLGRSAIPESCDWKRILKNPLDPYFAIVNSFIQMQVNGSSVHYYQIDVSNEDQVASILSYVKKELGAIKGVFHAAGVLNSQRIVNHNIDSFKEPLKAKVNGTVNLIRSLDRKELDFFVSFSSHNSLLPGTKSSNYSAANIFQDNYSHWLRQEGVNAISINWPSWRETGLWNRFYDLGKIEKDYLDQSILNDEGLAILQIALNLGNANPIVSKTDLNSLGTNGYFRILKSDPEKSLTRTIAKHSISVPSDNAFPPSWSKTQKEVASAWQSILVRSNLNLEDNFFELGGHSLIGARLVNQLEDFFLIQMEFKDLLKFPTIGKLSAFIENSQLSHVSSTKLPVIEEQSFYNLSASQKRIWLFEQKEKKQNAYNLAWAYKVHGWINFELTETVIDRIVSKYEILRTNFYNIKGIPKQRITPAKDIKPVVKEIILNENESSESQIIHLMHQEAARPYDLVGDNLIRIWVITDANHSQWLLICMHHIIVDGWSMGIFTNEFIRMYNAYKDGEVPDVSPLLFQYKDFTAWHNKELANKEQMDQMKKFWSEKFEGYNWSAQLPADFPRGRGKTFVGDRLMLRLSTSKSKRLSEICQSHQVSIYAMVSAITYVILCKFSGINDLIIGTSVASRNKAQLEDQLGFFANVLALRFTVHKMTTFSDFLKEIKKNLELSFENQAYPYENLVSDLNLHRYARSSLFDVMLVMETQQFRGDDGLDIDGLKLIHQDLGLVESRFDMTFRFVELANEIELSIKYNVDIFKRETIEQLGICFNQIVDEICENPKIIINSLIQHEVASLPENISVDRKHFDFEY